MSAYEDEEVTPPPGTFFRVKKSKSTRSGLDYMSVSLMAFGPGSEEPTKVVGRSVDHGPRKWRDLPEGSVYLGIAARYSDVTPDLLAENMKILVRQYLAKVERDLVGDLAGDYPHRSLGGTR